MKMHLRKLKKNNTIKAKRIKKKCLEKGKQRDEKKKSNLYIETKTTC